jgi:hypothetical protein
MIIDLLLFRIDDELTRPPDLFRRPCQFIDPKTKRPRENRIGLPMVVDLRRLCSFLRQQTPAPGRRPKIKAVPEAKVDKAGKKSAHDSPEETSFRIY